MKTVKKLFVTFMCVLMLVSACTLFASAASATKAQPEVKAKTASTVTLKWSKIKSADGYRVYKVVDGKLEKITDTKKTTYKISGLTASTSYKFAVRHYTLKNSTKKLAKSYGTVTTKTKSLAKFETFTATPQNNKITFKWNKISGASGYKLYVKNAEGKWEAIKTLSASVTSYTAALDGRFSKYTFGIRAYAKTGKSTVWNSYATCKTALTAEGKADILSATSTVSSITLNWEQISGADGYRIYAYSNGKYSVIDRTYGAESTTYTVNGLNSDSDYTFAIKAFSKKDGKTSFALLGDQYKVHTAKANLDVYRAEMVKDIIGGKEFYIEYSEEHPTYGRVDSVMALRMGKLYLKETVKGVSTAYILNTANDQVTVMDVNSKTYRTASASEELHILLAALREIMNIENMGAVKASYKNIDGNTYICESFTESKYGRYMELYFSDEHTLAGIYTKYADGSESTLKVANLAELAEPSLFEVPSDYKAK